MGSKDDWEALKSKLAADDEWLTYFITPVEHRVAELVVNSPPQDATYEPLLIEEWFEDLKSILDRCLSYRKEARDLEISAVHAALEYQRFCRLVDNNEKLEIAALGQTTLIAEREGSFAASSVFSKLKADLAPGFAASMMATVTRSEIAITDMTARQNIITDKWAAIRESELAFHQRHLSPGNAHNFLERYKRVISLYAQDLSECLLKANALALGIESIYKIEDPMPQLVEPYPGYLDRIVLWVRTVAIKVNRIRQEEVEYTIVIPLAQPWLTPAGGRLVSGDDISAAITPGGKPLEFDLTPVFAKQQNLRIRSVGLCFGTTPGADSINWRDRVSSVRVRATVHLPIQAPISTKVPARRRRPTLLANVGFISEASQAELVSGRSCANIDPRGKWTIFLEPLAVDADDTKTALQKRFWESDILTDIKVVMRVACKASTELSTAF